MSILSEVINCQISITKYCCNKMLLRMRLTQQST